MLFKQRKQLNQSSLTSYFIEQLPLLVMITVTGILCNAGLIAAPWFEGQLAQCLLDILSGNRVFQDMLFIGILYILSVGLVQFFRFLKRLVCRKFSNRVSLSLKKVIYHNIIHLPRASRDSAEAGVLMTKAISDADACAEGMRKFTTEIFDTGIAMLAYLIMLMVYDFRLTFIVVLFPPIAYVIANGARKLVTNATASARDSAGALNGATLDRVANALTYRVYGQEENRNRLYESFLTDYERKNVISNLFIAASQPLYLTISLISTVFIIWLGSKNVIGSGWKVWNIAAFSAYFACYLKLARKASRSANLFNAVQKAQVSWKRISPFLKEVSIDSAHPSSPESFPESLIVNHVSFSYPSQGNVAKTASIFSDVSFCATQGTLTVITGPVASGKSTLLKLFLKEYAYEGSILYNGTEIRDFPQSLPLSYIGHDPELLSDSIYNNITLGREGDISEVLKQVRIYDEVMSFPEGIRTQIGEGGIRLSGGQQARISLARVLYHKQPILLLDDPFSALDRKTEEEIMQSLLAIKNDHIILLVSHRLELFSYSDSVIWLEHGNLIQTTHADMLDKNSAYRSLYQMQVSASPSSESEKGGKSAC